MPTVSLRRVLDADDWSVASQDVEANFLTIESALNALGIFAGNGTPEGNVTAGVGSLYRRWDGGAGTSFYVKQSNPTGNTGWVGK